MALRSIVSRSASVLESVHTTAPLTRLLHASTSAADAAEPSSKALRNRLLYRSKQRGLLELDLLVGGWAEQNIPTMAEGDLTLFAEVLDQENPEMYKWLTRQEAPPTHLSGNPVFKALMEHVGRDLAASQPATHAAKGKEWVRGWNDIGRQPA